MRVGTRLIILILNCCIIALHGKRIHTSEAKMQRGQVPRSQDSLLVGTTPKSYALVQVALNVHSNASPVMPALKALAMLMSAVTPATAFNPGAIVPIMRRGRSPIGHSLTVPPVTRMRAVQATSVQPTPMQDGQDPGVHAEAQKGLAEGIEDIMQVARDAWRAYDDAGDLSLAEDLFSQAIAERRRLKGATEVVSQMGRIVPVPPQVSALLVGRARVRTDNGDFRAARADLNVAIKQMAPTGERANGIASYIEYPEAFVQRGLVREALGDFSGSRSDFDKAISLWGGQGHPYAHHYRGRAKVALGDLEGALEDFKTSAERFTKLRASMEQVTAVLAQEATTLYAMGRRDEAVNLAHQVIAKNPDATDLHAMLAADAFHLGNLQEARSEWEEACSSESLECSIYEDVDGWLSNVRRWPPVLLEYQREFVQQRVVCDSDVECAW